LQHGRRSARPPRPRSAETAQRYRAIPQDRDESEFRFEFDQITQQKPSNGAASPSLASPGFAAAASRAGGASAVLMSSPHSPQNRAAGEFSNPEFAQGRLNGAPHCSMNLSPSGLSAQRLEQSLTCMLPGDPKTSKSNHTICRKLTLAAGPFWAFCSCEIASSPAVFQPRARRGRSKFAGRGRRDAWRPRRAIDLEPDECCLGRR